MNVKAKAQHRLNLVISFVVFLTLVLVPKSAHAKWPPFGFRLTPSYADGRITYDLRFCNQAEWPMADVTIKIPLPAGTRYISADPAILAQRVLLDWQAWLEEGYVDLIVPRAYVDQDQPLAPVIADWQPVLEQSDRVMLGLKVYARRRGKEVKTADRILSEIELAYNNSSNGIILFDSRGLADDILEALAAGPFFLVRYLF